MLRISLAEQLEADGTYQPVEGGTYREGYQKGLEGLYEFMVLDVSLPDGDGRELCRAFRDSGVTCPIIILTASDSDADTIEGLKAGANDYITKPFRFAVLMARVDAHLRSHGASEEASDRRVACEVQQRPEQLTQRRVEARRARILPGRVALVAEARTD